MQQWCNLILQGEVPIPKTFLFLPMKPFWLHFIYIPRVKATILTTSVRVHRARKVRQFLGAGRNFLVLSLTYFTLRDFYQIYVWHNRKKKHVFFDQDTTFFIFKGNSILYSAQPEVKRAHVWLADNCKITFTRKQQEGFVSA